MSAVETTGAESGYGKTNNTVVEKACVLKFGLRCGIIKEVARIRTDEDNYPYSISATLPAR
jgi:hypothetical protein